MNDGHATWSAVMRCQDARKVDPIPGWRARLLPAWGSPATRKPIQWPLFLRLGQMVPGA